MSWSSCMKSSSGDVILGMSFLLSGLRGRYGAYPRPVVRNHLRAAPAGNAPLVPRALWTGSLAFGLVNAPVRMYSAIDEHDLELHLVHVKDGSPIGHRKGGKKEDEDGHDAATVHAAEAA